MQKNTEKQRVFSRRALVFGGVQAAAFTALCGRLYFLQFMRGEEFTTLSENNRIKLQLVAPARGNILDRNGVPMASSDKNYRLFIDYSTINQATLKSTLANLQKLLPLAEGRIKQLENKRISTAAMPDILKDHLSWDEVSLIELHMMDLPGAMIDIGQIRYYPLLDKAAHLIGYLGAVAQNELSDDDPPLMRLPDFKIGKNGVEKMLEDRLRGSAGIRQLEVNVHGMPVREVAKKDSIPGENVRLTVDANLQKFASELIKDQSASVVVIDVENGNILTLASIPAFDPNVFSKGISSEYWKELSTDKKAPLLNKPISGQYPPGSTFKMMVGMAALDAGLITPSFSVFCPGYFNLGDHTFKCWKQGGHGTVNYQSAIAGSCDTFFYTVAQKIGIDKYADMSRRFGLGEVHDIGLTGEKPGIIPDPAWKQKRYKQKWTGGDTINCAIGQGYVLATPLQLGVMAARLATGKEVIPRLYVEEGEENPEFDSLDISDELIQLNIAAMSSVTNTQAGTAYSHRIADPRFMMAGKTGTSQVRHLIREGMNQNSLPWEFRHHALFVGFAPVDKPKYACCVMIEHGGGGASAAAPVARDVLLRIQQIDAGVDLTPSTAVLPPIEKKPAKTAEPEKNAAPADDLPEADSPPDF